MKQVNIIIVSLLTFFLLATIWGCKETKTSQSLINGTWEFATAGECTITPPTTDQGMPFTVTLSIANQMGIPTTTFTQAEPISFTAALTNVSQQPQWVWLTMCAPFFVTINITNILGNTVTDVNSDISPCCLPPTWNPQGGLYFSIPAGGTYCVKGIFREGTQQLQPGYYIATGSFLGFSGYPFSQGVSCCPKCSPPILPSAKPIQFEITK